MTPIEAILSLRALISPILVSRNRPTQGDSNPRSRTQRRIMGFMQGPRPMRRKRRPAIYCFVAMGAETGAASGGLCLITKSTDACNICSRVALFDSQ